MMNLVKKIIWPGAGKYIIAVSGGIDSVVLLDSLASNATKHSYELMVAHFDHGIRKDSAKDAKFVKNLAAKYGLKFDSRKVKLGKNASEALAREKRYEFLLAICKKNNASGIITAHHLDDRIETALFNYHRGTGRRGLVPFNNSNILRPFINISRQDIETYAKENKLTWQEDPTNQDLRYARNRIRLEIIPKLEKANPNFRKDFKNLLNALQKDNQKIEALLSQKLAKVADRVTNSKIDLKRSGLIKMPQSVCAEFMHYSLKQLDPASEISSSQINRLVHFAKTAKAAAVFTIGQNFLAKATKQTITLQKT